ncbi:MAG: 23S rRNA (uracil(1939)-C(5))-methyltransferase RlmD, partial [Prevotella sp.]|nr:23S rRNA (uracil(1939)-C(5))-methyltransferase RlmD [Prevotella sp.]
LDQGEMASAKNVPAMGFHITGAFDKVLPIQECWLMDRLHNDIRNGIYAKAVELGMTFFDLRAQVGLLRDVIMRNSNTGEWMIIVMFHFSHDAQYAQEKEQADTLLKYIADTFPQITSLLWLDNQKGNDTIGDQEIFVYKGNDHIFEQMEDLRFKVGPKSFYQTNTEQAYELYKVVRHFAFRKDKWLEALPEKPLVYDLYTGTGTIANFVAHKASRVIGIEYVEEAIADAKINAEINGNENTAFFAGDMKDILTDDFIAEHGRPDVIITDPPRAGMHPDVVKTILQAAPTRIVYVSCNPATQARDLQMMDEKYEVMAIQPVDMFPHTPHVENVALLQIRK